MLVQALVEQTHDARMPLRNEPVQARSTARLATLLDAAAAVVDEIGYELLTTAMVAERAGASIGTVYRYFPDRIALLQALGARNLERVLGRVLEELRDELHPDAPTALGAAFDSIIDAFRDEPGFRGLRVGDVLDLRPAASERPFNAIVADRLLDGLIARFGLSDSADLRLRFQVAVEVCDALAARAFARDSEGDAAFLRAGRDFVSVTLIPQLGGHRSH